MHSGHALSLDVFSKSSSDIPPNLHESQSLTLYVTGGGEICPPLRKLLISLKKRFVDPYRDLLTLRVCPLRFFYKELEHPMCLGLILADYFWAER